MAFLRSMPILQVNSTAASIAFYKRLGFSGIGWEDNTSDELGFVIAQRGDVTIGLCLAHGSVPKTTAWAMYLYVDNLEELHQEFTDELLTPTPIHRPDYYGCDDFSIIDPDEHCIAFGQAREPGHGPGLSDQRGKG